MFFSVLDLFVFFLFCITSFFLLLRFFSSRCSIHCFGFFIGERDYGVFYLIRCESSNSVTAYYIVLLRSLFFVVVVRFVVACAFFRKIYFYCCKTEWVGMGRFLNRIENIVGHTLPASYPLTVCGESVHIVHRYVVKVRKYL